MFPYYLIAAVLGFAPEWFAGQSTVAIVVLAGALIGSVQQTYRAAAIVKTVEKARAELEKRQPPNDPPAA